MQPVEYRSERASTDWPCACSGERYWAVPMTAWVCVIVALASAMRAGDAEVHHLDRAVVGDHHVGGLDVAVDDAVAVAVAERVEHALGDPQRLGGAERCPLGDHLAQGLAVDVLHDDVGHRDLGTTGLGDAGPRRGRRPRRSTAWLSPAADCASRRNRARKVWSRARSLRSILMATWRPSRESYPRCTSAIPPRPRSSATS